MAISPEHQERILARIQERAPGMGVCPICRSPEWRVQNAGYVVLTLQDNMAAFRIGGGPSMPMVTITCQNCGNTQLLNMIVLGLEDMVRPPRREPQDG